VGVKLPETPFCMHDGSIVEVAACPLVRVGDKQIAIAEHKMGVFFGSPAIFE
jgi:hypothetical protein